MIIDMFGFVAAGKQTLGKLLASDYSVFTSGVKAISKSDPFVEPSKWPMYCSWLKELKVPQRKDSRTREGRIEREIAKSKNVLRNYRRLEHDEKWHIVIPGVSNLPLRAISHSRTDIPSSEVAALFDSWPAPKVCVRIDVDPDIGYRRYRARYRAVGLLDSDSWDEETYKRRLDLYFRSAQFLETVHNSKGVPTFIIENNEEGISPAAFSKLRDCLDGICSLT